MTLVAPDMVVTLDANAPTPPVEVSDFSFTYSAAVQPVSFTDTTVPPTPTYSCTLGIWMFNATDSTYYPPPAFITVAPGLTPLDGTIRVAPTLEEEVGIYNVQVGCIVDYYKEPGVPLYYRDPQETTIEVGYVPLFIPEPVVEPEPEVEPPVSLEEVYDAVEGLEALQNTAPYFEDEGASLLAPVFVEVGQPFDLFLVETVDDEEDNVTIDVKLGQASLFLKYFEANK